MWSDGEPLTAADIAFTYNRILDGGPEASTWGSYLTSVTKVEAPDDTTVVLTLEKPNAVLPLLPIPIVPEHVWSSIDEKAVKTYAGRADRRSARGRVRPVPAGRGHRRRLDVPLREATPTTGRATSYVDEVVFRVYKSEDPMVQALIKGEIDFAEDITRAPGARARGRGGHHRPERRLPRLRRDRASTPAPSTLETDEPIGDGHEALKDPAFRYALSFAIDRDLIVEQAYQGAGQPGRHDHPAGLQRLPLGRRRRRTRSTFDLDKADAAARRGRATPGAPTASA